ncbi:MAG: hypothetical protein Q8J88_11720 [Bacteroidales bacterium]|nr:hypothetical protein [Bacteroidales bacterium]
MNKYIKYAALLTILSLAMLFSCQKNEEDEVGSEQQFQMTESAQIAYNKLVAFKQALDNPQKSTTSMQLDSAEWYVEAFYNVTLGYPDSLFGKFEVDTMYYTLPLDENQMAAISDLGLLLDNMENHLNSLLTQTGTEVAHMVVGDVVIDFTGRSSDAVITVYTGLGFGTGRLYQPFADDDDWYYGNMLGRCDGQYQWESDAGEELEWRFNSPNPYHVPYPACLNGKIVIISVNETTIAPGTENAMIYHEWLPGANNPPCIDYITLNELLQNGATLFYSSSSNGGMLTNGIFAAVDVTSYGIPREVNGVSGYDYYHGYSVTYATYECIPGGGIRD